MQRKECGRGYWLDAASRRSTQKSDGDLVGGLQ